MDNSSKLNKKEIKHKYNLEIDKLTKELESLTEDTPQIDYQSEIQNRLLEYEEKKKSQTKQEEPIKEEPPTAPFTGFILATFFLSLYSSKLEIAVSNISFVE